ncbi:hypothetical protein Bca52824_035871 [Brassica carinata]|uniref:Uncharacterized protein n=1 Tax=Brassica carinata TaxID=52824 RepID=A0A8X7V241_BRACI|nr:hypothetical protein Bca52824_035871 [Brassica carinata]
MFPWLLCYIWKARNEKCFDGKDISVVDTLQLSCQEAESWRRAQLGDEIDEGEEVTKQIERNQTPQAQECIWKCQVDASWSESDPWMGLGFVFLEAEREILVETKCRRKGSSRCRRKGSSRCRQRLKP